MGTSRERLGLYSPISGIAWDFSEAFWTISGPTRENFGDILGDLGSWEHFGTILGACWGILALFGSDPAKAFEKACLSHSAGSFWPLGPHFVRKLVNFRVHSFTHCGIILASILGSKTF